MGVQRWRAVLGGFVVGVASSIVATVLTSATAATALGLTLKYFGVSGKAASLIAGGAFVGMVVVWSELLRIHEVRRALTREREQERLAHRTWAEIEQQVRDWFHENRFAVKNENPSGRSGFILCATDHVAMPIYVTADNHDRWAMLLVNVTLAGANKTDYVFMRELGAQLCLYGVDYMFVLEDDKKSFKGVRVSHRILFDEMTNDLAIPRAVQFIRRAATLVNTLQDLRVRAPRFVVEGVPHDGSDPKPIFLDASQATLTSPPSASSTEVLLPPTDVS